MTSSDGSTAVLDHDGHPLLTLVGSASPVTSVDIAPDLSRFATVDQDGDLRVFDATTGDVQRQVHVKRGLASVSFSSDSRTLYTDDADGTVSEFDACPLCGDGAALLDASRSLAIRGLTDQERRTFGVTG